MGTLLYNEYMKSVHNISLSIIRQTEILLCLFIAVITFFVTYLDRKKNTIYLLIFYVLLAALYFIYKRAGRI